MHYRGGDFLTQTLCLPMIYFALAQVRPLTSLPFRRETYWQKTLGNKCYKMFQESLGAIFIHFPSPLKHVFLCLSGIKPFPGTYRGLKRLDELFHCYSYSERWIAAHSETRMCCEKLKPKEYVTSNVSSHGYWGILSDKTSSFSEICNISKSLHRGREVFVFF